MVGRLKLFRIHKAIQSNLQPATFLNNSADVKSDLASSEPQEMIIQNRPVSAPVKGAFLSFPKFFFLTTYFLYFFCRSIDCIMSSCGHCPTSGSSSLFKFNLCTSRTIAYRQIIHCRASNGCFPCCCVHKTAITGQGSANYFPTNEEDT